MRRFEKLKVGELGGRGYVNSVGEKGGADGSRRRAIAFADRLRFGYAFLGLRIVT
jgi:hypothetical protein